MGNTAEIYLRDGHIVKVYSRHSKQDVEHEAANQAYARSLGLPAPAVIEITESDGARVEMFQWEPVMAGAQLSE